MSLILPAMRCTASLRCSSQSYSFFQAISSTGATFKKLELGKDFGKFI
jgi:hypothetical protein